MNTNLGLHIIGQSISNKSTVPVTKATACCHCEVEVYKRGSSYRRNRMALYGTCSWNYSPTNAISGAYHYEMCASSILTHDGEV